MREGLCQARFLPSTSLDPRGREKAFPVCLFGLRLYLFDQNRQQFIPLDLEPRGQGAWTPTSFARWNLLDKLFGKLVLIRRSCGGLWSQTWDVRHPVLLFIASAWGELLSG